MQTLPANGQAQPLPAKWVIKRTPANAEMVNKWLTKKKWDEDQYEYTGKNKAYAHSDGQVLRDVEDGFTLIADEQFKAMVEGERPDTPDAIDAKIEEENKWKKTIEQHQIIQAYNILLMHGHRDLTDQLKAKHPDIWPVDYAAIVLEKAVAWEVAVGDVVINEPDLFVKEAVELVTAVRNYLTNQNK